MKKILSYLIIGLMLFGCKDRNENILGDKGKFDPQAMIVIKPAKGMQLRSTVGDLTALQIVERTLNIKWQSHWFDNTYWDEAKDIGRGFREDQKDFNLPALKMLGIDIIDDNGVYYKDFIYGYNIVITDANNDTIAYVPDEVINAARPLIEEAFADSNYTEVYRIFNEAFTFRPIE